MNIYEILALIALGFILRRALKSEKPFVHLNKFASHVLLTLFVFSSIASKDLDYLIEIRVVFLCVFLIIALSLGSSFLYARLFVRDKEWAGTLMVLSTYPNTEAMGYPIASLFLDDLTPAIIYANINRLILLPIVTFVAAHYSIRKASLRESLTKALKFTPTSANLLALSLVILGIKLPGGLLEIMNGIGWWNIPLILIYFGSRINLEKFEWRKLFEVGIFRIALPFVFVFLTLNAPPEIFYAVLVEASMPPAIIANVILAHYGLREEEGIGITIILTLVVLFLFLLLRIGLINL